MPVAAVGRSREILEVAHPAACPACHRRPHTLKSRVKLRTIIHEDRTREWHRRKLAA